MRTPRSDARLLTGVVLLAALSCRGDERITSPHTSDLVSARKTSAPTVTSADPAFGYQGDAARRVRIAGSGFEPGAVVAWERDGVADPKVRVTEAVVLSSTEIDATIDIAADADLDLYDISVMSADKGKGIGTEMFEVTTAISVGTLGGNTQMNAATDNMTGVAAVGWSHADNVQWAVVWDAEGGLRAIDRGRAFAVDVAGTTVGGSSDFQAMIWTSESGEWRRSPLPVAAVSPRSEVNAIASDDAGVAVLAGGFEGVQVSRRAVKHIPVVWRRSPDGWTRIVLSGSYGAVRAVNARGQAVGNVDGAGATFWDSLGNRTTLPGNGGPATGIDASGTIVAGVNNAGKGTAAVYWQAAVQADGSRVWSGPFILPGNCERAIAVDDFGRIAGHRCLVSNTRYTSAVWEPPYENAVSLTGFGDRSDAGSVWGSSRRGTRLVGHAQFVGALWEHLFVTPQ